MKEYKARDVSIEAPPEGWGIVWFADGYKAQCSGSKVETKEGKEYVKLYLMPYDALMKRFGIDRKKDLDNQGYCYKYYPKEFIRPLNLYDSARRIFFCMMDWNGKETEATKWFLGKEQAEELIKLKNALRAMKAHNERLREENMLIKTNVNKYIKDTVEGIIKPIMPSIRTLITPELAKNINSGEKNQ